MRRSNRLELVWICAAAFGLSAATACGEPEDSPQPEKSLSSESPDSETPDAASEDVSETSDADGETDGTKDTGIDGTDDLDADGTCVPSESAWDTNVGEMVETWCGQCHGEEPKYGAPFSLTEYHELVAGEPGERKVDRMAEQLLADAMPPPTADQPTHVAEDTLVEWATCGEKHPDHSEGVTASKPPMDAPEQPPEGAETLDVIADGFELGENELNRYQCFVIDVPFETTRYARRFEPIVDDDRVLHHSLVSIDSSGSSSRETFECNGFPPGDGLLYGWAPGQNPIQFDPGGIALEPGSQIVLQIHYNNGAGATGVSDSSGVRIFHTDSTERELTMSALGPTSFSIPPKTRGSAESTCSVAEQTEIVASFPHMHEIGSEFHSHIERSDGSRESLIDLTGWSFEAQLAYQTPTTLEAGDKITTQCIWDNPHDRTVGFGLRTEDEMCFNFVYVTPPNAGFCN